MKAKKLLTLALGAALAVSLTVPAMAAGKTFPDVPGTWAESSITRWANAGVLEGDNTGEYKPSGPMTRAEFAAMLCKLMGYTEKAKNTYADVQPTAWYYDVILKVTAAGVMKGDGVNANPNAPVSREEAAVMLCRALNLKGESKTVTKFDDSAAVASWAQEAVAALTERGMINGVGDNKFAPAQNIDRASAAKLLDNMIHTYITAPGEYKVDDPDAIVIVNAKAVTAPEGETAPAVTVTGAAADVIVAPGTDAAVQAEDLTAGAVTVQADAAVTVDKDSKVDDLTVAAPADVTVAGQVENATLADGALTVADGGKVDAVAVPETAADDVSVTVDKGASVGTVTADAPVAMENNGTVAKVEANADGVVIDGNAPQKIETAEGVTPPTNSEGETVKEEPASSGSSSSGGGSSTPTTKYTVTVSTATNGTLTSNVTEAAEGATVIITGKPQVQYALKSVSVASTPTADTPAPTAEGPTDDKEVSEATKKSDNVFSFIMPAADVTVTGDFEKPISNFKTIVIDSQEVYKQNLPAAFRKWDSGNQTEDFGGWDNLADYPWLAIIAEKDASFGEVTDKGTATITFTSAGKTTNVTIPGGWESGIVGNLGACTAYVKEQPDVDPNNPADVLGIQDTYGDFEVTLKYAGATYIGKATYTANGTETVQVTFKNGEATFDTQTVEKNGKATEPADKPTKEGHKFLGWYKDSEETAFNFTGTAIESAITLNAKFEANKYAVTYNANGGTGTVAVGEATFGQSFTPDTNETEDAKFTREGYTFDGWNTKADGSGTTIATSAANWNIAANTTLYAQWKINEYTVTFNKGESDTETKKVEHNKTVAKPETDPTAEGKKFLGWYADQECKTEFNFSTKITADTTIYAKWAKYVNPSTVAISITGVPQTLGIKVTTEYNSGTIGYTVDKAAFEKAWPTLTDDQKGKLEHEGILYIRVNSDVPTDVIETTKWQPSYDGGKTYMDGAVVTADALGATGTDVTVANGKINTIGDWFGIAIVPVKGSDDTYTFQYPENASWNVVYMWTSAEGEVQYTYFTLTRTVVEEEKTETTDPAPDQGTDTPTPTE